MASDLSFVQYVSEQIAGAGAITFRKMFGEYAVYCDSKVVALVCDNQLYVKPTGAGRLLAAPVTEAPPYPGARPHLLIDEKLDDRAWMAGLIAATARELPPPKVKKPGAAAPRKGKAAKLAVRRP
jgi:TfoX/Sxy family transcriptional regulator of competence genes